ncbi:MAG: hypothetical protein ACRDDX_11365 [Cellulosilyticaceae bacterium]
MAALEKQFEQELIKKSELAAKECAGYRGIRFLQTIEKFGGVKTAKEILRKGRVSDDFDKLQVAGLLKYSMEATIIDRKYGELFDDEEVNSCFEVLCENGYY